MNAFDYFAFFQFCFWHSADAHRSKVCVPGLDAPQAAQVLVALWQEIKFRLEAGK